MSSKGSSSSGYQSDIIATEVTPMIVVAEEEEQQVPVSSSSCSTSCKNKNKCGIRSSVISNGWKSGLCSCCKYGCFHPALLCAWCFPTIFMGQLLTRMKMTWLGDLTSPPSEEYKKTFRTVVTIWICYILIGSISYCPWALPEDIDVDEDGNVIIEDGGRMEDGIIVMVRNNNADDCPLWKQNLVNIVGTIFGLYTLIVMIRLRMTIRAKYNIPEAKNCTGCEDCCCIFFCGCCSAVQMAHQTADYDNNGDGDNEVRAICCNSTGLPPSSSTSSYYDDDDFNNNDDNNNNNSKTTPLTQATIV